MSTIKQGLPVLAVVFGLGLSLISCSLSDAPRTDEKARLQDGAADVLEPEPEVGLDEFFAPLPQKPKSADGTISRNDARPDKGFSVSNREAIARPQGTSSVRPEIAKRPDASASRRPSDKEGEVVIMRWQANDKDVIAYHVYYGNSPESLSGHKVLPAQSLKCPKDPILGKVCSFDFNLPKTTKDWFFSIRAENQTGISSPSETFRLRPKDPSGTPLSGDFPVE